MSPAATILLTSKNRRDELRRALHSAVNQTGAVIEIMVIDDGSTDGTSEMVRTEFPQLRLERREESRGYIVRRNEGAKLASAPVVFSIDDDAEFSSTNIVAKILKAFDHPRIGAVTIPFINVLQRDQIFQKTPDTLCDEAFATDTYIGTAHALRRDIFLSLAGYREHFIHQGEEGDYCIRMLNAGYVVRLGGSDPIHHFESPKRDTRRMDFYGRRNDLLFAWHNVPMPYFPAHLGGTIINGLLSAAGADHPWAMVKGIFAGAVVNLCHWNGMKPVTREIYKLHRRLKKLGPIPLSEIKYLLPKLSGTNSMHSGPGDQLNDPDAF